MALRIKGSKRINLEGDDWIQIRSLNRREREACLVSKSIMLGNVDSSEGVIGTDILSAVMESSESEDILDRALLGAYDLVALCTKSIQTWSELEEDGTSTPVTEANIAMLPDDVLMKVGASIISMTRKKVVKEKKI